MKNLEYYMSLDYTMNIRTETDFDQSKYFIATFVELEGLEGTGNTIEAAINDLNDAKENWFKVNIDLNRNIPVPHTSIKNNPTKLTVRLPYTLNQQVEDYMNYEGISKNNAINSLISSGLIREASKRYGLSAH
ncbi:type II toxin-antitoxin system HicB family antitoxin [Macrococcoides canis]|uniref:type II toxin-antitoxin system HicB family antitoxin n=1 Tax=Macrococcoides canis TaxID=1855823 RepID=UPI001AEC4F68|nr:type II toxin-antitoxin system HicB family antitoxin [Macrococcus canis]QTQ09098.1 type II toxin-antitoxin system HicB family antitoxin [Macrococcus canis]